MVPTLFFRAAITAQALVQPSLQNRTPCVEGKSLALSSQGGYN